MVGKVEHDTRAEVDAKKVIFIVDDANLLVQQRKTHQRIELEHIVADDVPMEVGVDVPCRGTIFRDSCSAN